MDGPTQFATPTGISWQGTTGIVEYGGGDRGMVCLFYNKSTHNPAKSLEAGRPVHEDVTFVRIHPPGERFNIIDRPMKQEDAQRWPTQWQQFLKNHDQIPDGTPIDILYPNHPSVAQTLRANAIHTIEQLADLSAHAIENIGMGCQRYVNDAKAFLDKANKGAGFTKMRQELENMERENKVLKQQVEDLAKQVKHLSEGNMGTVGLEQLQALLAGVMQRPVHAPSRSFDPQMAQINATHGSATAGPTKPSLSRRRTRPNLG